MSAACDSKADYPFIGKWALENPRAPDVGLCSFVGEAKISRAHIILPLHVLTITGVKQDKDRWILSVTGNGGPAPPVVIKDVTPQSLVLTDAADFMACKMRKTGECNNLLCD
jgi:hypothetical protein